MKTRTTTARLAAWLMIICTMLCVWVGNLSFTSTVLAADNHQERTVKVGYFHFDGYHDIDQYGVRCGYGYDFLQMISGFANFDYQYVGYEKSWHDMLEMLENGQIDMVTSARYLPERTEHFDFSEAPVGYSETVMTARADDERLVPGRRASYNGIRVGLLKGSSQNNIVFDMAKNAGITMTYSYFDRPEEMLYALFGQKVDAVVTSSIRVLGEEKVLERFDKQPYYAIVKKGNTELLNQINYAMRSLDSNNPDWRTTLQNRYYSTNAAHISLSTEEKDYLAAIRKTGKVLRVLVNPDQKPYSYFDEGKAKGVLIDYFDVICQLFKIKCEYVRTETAEEYYSEVQRKQADIVIAPVANHYEVDSLGYFMTRSFMNAPVCVISRSGSQGLTKGKYAIVSGMTTLEAAAVNKFPEAEIVKYKTFDDCIKAVESGKVDGTMAFNFTAYDRLGTDWDNSLNAVDISDGTIGFTLSVLKGSNPNLYTLLNKGISYIDNTKLQTIITKNTFESAKVAEPLWSYIYHKPALMFSLLGVLALAVGLCAWRRFKNMQEQQQQKRQAAEFEAAHDFMTGALNRVFFDDIAEHPENYPQKMGIMLLDIDYFKGINDNYSHEMGDEVLITMAQLIKPLFHDTDQLVRLGGDEFMLLLYNADRSAWESICKKLSTINRGLSNLLPDNMGISVSAGIIFTECGYSKELAKRADEALYNTKSRGRAGCTLVDKKGEVLDFWRDESVDYSVFHAMEQDFLCPCRIELSEDFTVRKLFGHSIMMETLDVPLGTSPEKTYQVFFDAIDDAFKPKMEKMFAQMLQGDTLELVVPWNHPKLGQVHLRVGGAMVENTLTGFTGYIMMGYYQILNDVYFMNTGEEFAHMVELINLRAANSKEKRE